MLFRSPAGWEPEYALLDRRARSTGARIALLLDGFLLFGEKNEGGPRYGEGVWTRRRRRGERGGESQVKRSARGGSVDWRRGEEGETRTNGDHPLERRVLGRLLRGLLGSGAGLGGRLGLHG